MKKVLLHFPDAISIAVFITVQSLANAEVNYRELFLIAALTEIQVDLACTQYKAVLKESIYTLHIFHD